MVLKSSLRTSPGNAGTASPSVPGEATLPARARPRWDIGRGPGWPLVLTTCAPTKESCDHQPPTPVMQLQTPRPSQTSARDLHCLQCRAGAGEGTLQRGGACGFRTCPLFALLSSHLHGVASAPWDGEASGKDLGSAARIQPPSQLPLSPSLNFPICKVELTIISISKGVSRGLRERSRSLLAQAR